MKKYLMGTWVEGWREAKAQNLTFIVTEDCNLRCKYCYVTHKSSNARMTFETAKKFIDYIFKIKRNEQHAVGMLPSYRTMKYKSPIWGYFHVQKE